MLANPPGTGGQCQKWLLQFALSGSRCANYKRAIGDRLGDASVLLRGLEGTDAAPTAERAPRNAGS